MEIGRREPSMAEARLRSNAGPFSKLIAKKNIGVGKQSPYP